MYQFSLNLFILVGILISGVYAQQNYSGPSVWDCNSTDEAGPSPAFLYTCNGEKKPCRAFLTFRPQPPYASVANISKLTSSDPSELARINNVSKFAVFKPNVEVIVPITCSCSGQYYQADTSYILAEHDTYYTVSTNNFQALTTCDSVSRQNPYDPLELKIGTKLQIPLRCACPTKKQQIDGINFLLTYGVIDDETVTQISDSFKVKRTGVTYANGLSEEASVLYGETTILIPLEKEPVGPRTRIKSSSLKSKKVVLTGIVTGISVAVFCLVLFLFYTRSKHRAYDHTKQKRELPRDLLAGVAHHVDQNCLKVFDFDELEEATENFSPENKLGTSVYHGVLRGKMLAVKRMSRDISREVHILKRINHFNLIALYGACEHGNMLYLVYELMENGCLKEWLRKKTSPNIHSWNCRIRIALDVANGLLYLHNFTSPAYVHKDINSSNILLNRDLRAKIANFSLARSADTGENGNSSIKFSMETKGYKAPEYLEANMVSPKVDIYAFGVVLLELITGREVVWKQDGEEILLSEAVLAIMNEGDTETKLQEFIDPCLQMEHPLGYIIDQTDLMMRMINLSVACLQVEPSRRLSASKVVSTLMKIQMDALRPEFSSM
ncbi:lysM domain receptor-like kinase 4 [Apium graveolens]|uniref:lysM domain receptor-like kinase 4 n=1 Tax=Apium graveolens TaxID=4045 RepID=UPI003D78C6A5